MSSSTDPVGTVGGARRRVLQQVTAQLPYKNDDSCVLVGIDGPDGSGKTIFADHLASVVRALGRPVLRISLDDFHHRRDRRYRLGRDSPVGFWLDSYDYGRFTADVLEPLGPSCDLTYRSVAHDLATDHILDPPWQRAEPGSVVIVDGLFLHRAELVDWWDHTVYLDVPFDVTAARMALRDGTSADPDHPHMRRYVDAQRIYLAECAPRSRAATVIDNSDPAAPVVRTAPARTADRVDLTLDSYTASAQLYLDSSPGPPPEVRRYLDAFARLSPGGQVLELGSGPGWDADHLESRGMRVQRTDASQAFVERLRAAGHDAVLLDARADDFGGLFDAVLADAVLLHLDRAEFEAALCTARRAVRDGGALGLTLKEGDGSAWSTAKLDRPRHFTFWRSPELVDALQRSSWRVHSLQHVAGRSEPWIFVLAVASGARAAE